MGSHTNLLSEKTFTLKVNSLSLNRPGQALHDKPNVYVFQSVLMFMDVKWNSVTVYIGVYERCEKGYGIRWCLCLCDRWE